MWIDLQQLKGQLDNKGTVDDVRLVRFAAAACARIEQAIGRVEAYSVIEVVEVAWDWSSWGSFGAHDVILSESPVAHIDRIEGLGAQNAVVSTLVAGRDYDVNVRGSLVTLPAGTWRISYTAGRDPIPANIEMATYMLAEHLYRSDQLRTGGGRIKVGDNEQLIPGMSHAMPLSVLELLGLADGKIGRNRTWVG